MEKKKIKLNLTGLNGNAFVLLGAFQQQARKENWTSEEVEKVITEAMSKDYDHLVATLVSYCDMD